MLEATLLALAAAVLHAGWNLAVKQSPIDRFVALWGQFTASSLLAIPFIIGFGGLPAHAWRWVAISGAVHLPYCYFLAKAYESGDFSLVYPIARGGGAMLGAVGGVLFLSDQLSLFSGVAIGVVGVGLFTLAGRGNPADIGRALIVALAIGIYSTADAKGIRTAGTPVFALAGHLGTAVSTGAFGLATGKRQMMGDAWRRHWRRFAILGFASTVTYGMVQLAFRRAPVGYVTALRESSVVLAAFLGWKHLDEQAGLRRLAASAIVLVGLLLLVLSRA
jgi:drug/metabolite transporter (DMT)-like permease